MDRERLCSLMESKDKARIDQAGGAISICKELGSDPTNGIQDVSEGGLATRKQRYGTNVVERKPPHSFFFLFFEAMKDATILILLAASSIAIIIGASICGVNIGGMCRRKPLWDAGASKELYEYEVSLIRSIYQPFAILIPTSRTFRNQRRVHASNGWRD